jgi:hypothetical protein
VRVRRRGVPPGNLAAAAAANPHCRRQP